MKWNAACEPDPSPYITAWFHWFSCVWKEANPHNHVPTSSGKLSQKSASCYSKKMANACGFKIKRLMFWGCLNRIVLLAMWCTVYVLHYPLSCYSVYRCISFHIGRQLRSQSGKTFVITIHVIENIMSYSMTLLTSHIPSSSNWSFYSEGEKAKISNMCLKFIVFFCFLFVNEVHQELPSGSVGGRG